MSNKISTEPPLRQSTAAAQSAGPSLAATWAVTCWEAFPAAGPSTCGCHLPMSARSRGIGHGFDVPDRRRRTRDPARRGDAAPRGDARRGGAGRSRRPRRYRPAVTPAIGGRPVDALLANAARGLDGGFLDQELDDWHSVVDTNITGTLLLTRRSAATCAGLGGAAAS